MKKAQKRKIGLAAQEANLQDSVRSGLEAQSGDAKRRAEKQRAALESFKNSPMGKRITKVVDAAIAAKEMEN